MSAAGKIATGTLEIDFAAYRVLRNGKPVRLTRTEWSLLGELVQHRNQVLSHRTLLQRVWGTEYGSESDYVHTYISRLRRKLEDDPADPQYILTEPGVGYLFQKDVSRPVIAASSPAADAQPARIINPFPLVVSPYYVGREAEQNEIRRLLAERTPLISVYGRAGVGKTALTCKILMSSDVQSGFDGIVLLSASSTGINLPRILFDFYRLLEYGQIAADEKPEPRRQITELLELLNQGNYVLLLDNLETYQDASGALTIPDLELFLTMALQQGGALRILLTSREPLFLPRPLKLRERSVVLEEGLSTADSIQLLRRCDPDNAAGLRDAPDEKLKLIAERTRGFPRALEAAAGLLLEDAFLDLDSLLADNALFSGEMNEILVHSALARLDESSQRVMELAAAFKRPITQEELSLIAAPFMDTSSLRHLLNRLVKAFFLKYDPQNGQLSAHPSDLDYCYASLPDGDAAYSRRAIHRHIAAFYHSRQQPDGRIDSIQEFELHRNEIEHLMDAGDYDAAAAQALLLDERYMTQHGHYTDLVTMYESLREHTDDKRLARDVMRSLGEAYRSIGRVNEAVSCYEKALQIALEGKDTSELAARHAAVADEGAALSCLGWAHYDLGKFVAALGFWERARVVFAGIGDPTGTASVYGGTGWVSYLLGDYSRAEENFQKALAIFQERDDERGMAVNQGDLGIVQMAQGQYEQAIEQLNYALNIADENQFIREISYKAAYLAVAYLLSDKLEQADETIRMSIQYSEISVNLPSSLAVHGVILARLNRHDEAVEVFHEAVQRADNVLALTVGLYHVLYARGLANAGLSLLAGQNVQYAIDDYERAMTICGEAGVKQANFRLLEALMQVSGGEKLASVKSLFSS